MLGKNNWVGNNTTITKGTLTSDGTIITHGSLVNKDFSSIGDSENSIAKTSLMLSGTPAKIIAYGSRRIFDSKIEKEIDDYFKLNPQESTFKFEQTFHDEVEVKYFL